MHHVFVQWCWEKSIVSRGCEYSLLFVTNVLENRVARQMMTNDRLTVDLLAPFLSIVQQRANGV